MIYNKPTEARLPFEPTEERKNPVVLCADMDEYELYSPVKVNRRRLRQEKRRIRKSSRCFSLPSALFATLFALLTMVAVLWFSKNGVPETDDVKTAAVSFLSKTSEHAGRLVRNSKEKISELSYSIPVHLNAGVKGDVTENPQRVVYANGYEPEETVKPENGDMAENANTTDVSAQIMGKTGVDGKVYLPLVSRNLASDNMLLLSNETKLLPDTEYLSQKVPKAYENIVLSDKPLVLIVHTHATECYTSGSDGMYEKNEPARSDDISENVVAVGKTLSDTLRNFGIPVLHSTTLHDKASFLSAYTSSLNEVHRILGENPSIRFVIDLHRDAIESGVGEKTAPVIRIAGENYAQLMFVMGTNEAGFNHPDWEDNLCFALDMQMSMNQAFPGIMRPINLRSVSFNEQLSSGYVLLEAGAFGNTLDEAKRSAEAFGTVLAGKILQNAKNM